MGCDVWFKRRFSVGISKLRQVWTYFVRWWTVARNRCELQGGVELPERKWTPGPVSGEASLVVLLRIGGMGTGREGLACKGSPARW